MNKARVKAGAISAPSMKGSIAAAGAAEDLKDKMEGNGISHGEKPAVAPETPAGAPTRAERRRKAGEKVKPSDIPKQGRTGKQAELPGMPKLDSVGRAARAFLEATDTLESAKTARVESMAKLVTTLKAAKRKEISVDGYTISYVHKEAVDRIKIKKPSTK